MNLKQYLIGKKRGIPLGLTPEEHENVRVYNTVYNQAIEDIISALPKLEKGLMVEVGEDKPMQHDFISDYVECTNQERSRFRTIIHKFFN